MTRKLNHIWLASGSLMLILGSASLAYGHSKDKTSDARKDAKLTQTFDYKDFDAIRITGVYDIDIKADQDFSITISGDDDEMSRLEVTEKNGVLYLGMEKGKWNNKNRHGVDATITLPKLTALDVSGVAEVDGRNIDSENFDLAVAGVADVELAGKCQTLDVEITGVGDINTRNLKCESVDVSVTGVGEATVYASEKIDANASGMGNITVYGKPTKVKTNKSLFTNVTIK